MPVRLVTFYDKDKERHFEFITNNFRITSFQVAQIYKQRWQIEIMFKRLKSNNPLKYFLGDNPNAIKVQIWVSLIADLLIQVVRKRLEKNRKKWSFSNLAGLIRQHLFTYVNLKAFLLHPDKSLLQNNILKQTTNQLLIEFDST